MSDSKTEGYLAQLDTSKPLSCAAKKRLKRNKMNKAKKHRAGHFGEFLLETFPHLFPSPSNTREIFAHHITKRKPNPPEEQVSILLENKNMLATPTHNLVVLDVAGGRGDVCWDLITKRGVKSCVVVDPVPVRLNSNRTKRILSTAWRQLGCPHINDPTDADTIPLSNAQLMSASHEARKHAPAPPTSSSSMIDSNSGQLSLWMDHNERYKAGDMLSKAGEALLLEYGFGQYRCEFNVAITQAPRAQQPNHTADDAVKDDDNIHIKQQQQCPTPMTLPPLHVYWESCDLVIGMHPDQATEAIVDAALLANKPFAVVPCCVFPSLWPDRKLLDGTPVIKLPEFIQYLCEKDAHIQTAVLQGLASCNVVVYRHPPLVPVPSTSSS